MKILNLYAGIGGNRKLWGDEHQVTAVEVNPEILAVYQGYFPNDTVYRGDAHQYLLEHYKEFDFIWTSPPCPTHGSNNNFLNAQGVIRYPDMQLWQEIIFLKHFFKGKWLVENVVSYYEPLIPPQQLDRHYFWSNFLIPPFEVERTFNINNARASNRQSNEESLRNLETYHGFKLPDKTKNQRLLLRNCVYPPLAAHILKFAINPIKLQKELF